MGSSIQNDQPTGGVGHDGQAASSAWLPTGRWRWPPWRRIELTWHVLTPVRRHRPCRLVAADDSQLPSPLRGSGAALSRSEDASKAATVHGRYEADASLLPDCVRLAGAVPAITRLRDEQAVMVVEGWRQRGTMRAHRCGKTPDTMRSVEMRKRRSETLPKTCRRAEDALRTLTRQDA